MCSRYQSCPKEPHFSIVKTVMKYLRGTLDVGLWYPKGVEISLVEYLDSDFVGCILDRKRTSGTCHLLGHSLVSWNSKKQACVALSTVEADYIVARSYCAQILWLKQHLFDFGLRLEHIPLRCNNTSSISLTKNPIKHSRTKHIEIRHHFIKDHIHKGDYDIEFVDIDSQLADIFTKPLARDTFFHLHNEHGILSESNLKPIREYSFMYTCIYICLIGFLYM